MSMHGPEAHGWPGDDLDVPPHGLDLETIVQVGRRQVRRRRMATVGGTAAVLAAVAAIPATVPLRPSGGGGDAGESPAPSAASLPVLDCDVIELSLPDEYTGPEPGSSPSVVLKAMDPTGRYAIGDAYLRWSGDAGNESDPEGVVLWEDGDPTAPAPLRGNNEARDVNAEGAVVGRGGEESGYAWIYRDGELSQLPTPGGYASAEANAINAAGDVAGTATGDDGGQTVVVWPAGDPGNPRVLAAPPGQDVVASGITDDGLVIGEYYAGDHSGDWPADTGAYLWETDGTRVELPVPEGAYDVYGTAVRGGWGIGQALTEPEGPQPSPAPATGTSMSLLWNLSTRTLRVVAGSGSVPNQVRDVNAGGDLLFTMPPAVLRGEMYALPDPVERGAVTPPDTAYTPQVGVTAISDDGSTIAGDVYFDILPAPVTRLVHPVLWRC